MKLGNLDIQKLYLGGDEVSKVYLGSETVYQKMPKPSENGVYILYSDGSFSAYDSLTAGKTPVGPVLITNNVSLVIHPTIGSGKKWATNISSEFSGVTTTTELSLAKADFNGASNTAAALLDPIVGDAFTFASTAVYADGKTGFLPSCGQVEEIRQNVTNINTAMGLINGDTINFSTSNYWTSTQYGASKGWYWYVNPQNFTDVVKSNSGSAISVATY